jgi:hypothetical protein
MSFTVYEARAAFISFRPTAFTLAGVKRIFEPQVLARQKRRVDETPAT